ncbi:uncharacterized protein LOC112035263 [Quercus suber]|uniref:uncharacterized protein LOC112035263 n=1 Tax=Quercus suber TaxID=58331 RepID=UPI000CE190DF|nr:uncharacterized protein LOC112035263 [Quercus suber]
MLLLLDVCGIARDALLQTKECTRELQSTLRRRQGRKMELAREVEKYMASKKVAKKAIKKVLKAGSNLQSKSSGWFVVSKLVHPKRIACEGEETNGNDFEKVDAALQSLISHKTSKCDYTIHVQNVQDWMGKLESSLQDVEEVIECSMLLICSVIFCKDAPVIQKLKQLDIQLGSWQEGDTA